ncbi:MAG: hypothetical protein U0X20_03435 [Caldilineaceae bacterium]
MAITNKQYQSLQSEACRMAEELPNAQLHACLTALYEAGRLLHLTRPTLIGLLGSVALRCVLDEVDEDALPAAPAPGTWPRLLQRAGYDEAGNLVLVGADDNERMWCETLAGRSQEAWLLKELYVERRFGRRKKGGAKRKAAG